MRALGPKLASAGYDQLIENEQHCEQMCGKDNLLFANTTVGIPFWATL